MPPGATRSLAVVVCALVCLMTSLVARHPAGAARADDRNQDGRPDFWWSFDGHGRIAKVSIDSNFDGRSDVEEFYEGGVLVRRQTDRDFNNRIDLVQHFDPATHLLVRSLADADADGVADLLVLFQEGEPVYQKRADRPATELAPIALQTGGSDRADDDPLVPLDDPFSGDLSFKSMQVAVGAPAFAPCAPVGIPRHAEERSTFGTVSLAVVVKNADLSTAHAATFSTRAPPSLSLFS